MQVSNSRKNSWLTFFILSVDSWTSHCNKGNGVHLDCPCPLLAHSKPYRTIFYCLERGALLLKKKGRKDTGIRNKGFISTRPCTYYLCTMKLMMLKLQGPFFACVLCKIYKSEYFKDWCLFSLWLLLSLHYISFTLSSTGKNAGFFFFCNQLELSCDAS
jgi:hypothetical protein